MGFFNYDKPGKGIEKDAPRAKGVFLYFELLWRNIGKLILANLIYFGTSLPILVIYYLMSFAFLAGILPQDVDSIVLNQVAMIVTLVISVLWGTGPVSCGFTYVLRNVAREEHTWVVSDFFEKAREGFVPGLVFLIVDIVMFFSGTVAFMFYRNMAAGGSTIGMLYMGVIITVMIIYTAIHFYMYQIQVTFEGGIVSIYKNSFIMAGATIPMCILLGVIIYFVSVNFLRYLTPVGIILFALVLWMSAMRFIIDFYSARVIKRKLLPEDE